MSDVQLEVLGLPGPGVPPSVPAWVVERAEARGWKLAADWVPEMEDEETGDTLGGYWTALMYREELVDGDLLHYGVSLFAPWTGAAGLALQSERPLGMLLDLADRGWEDLVATHTSRGASG